MAAVLEIAHRHGFGQRPGLGGDIPHQPVQLIVRRLVARAFHVVHVQHVALRAHRRVRPGKLRRRLFTGLRVLQRDQAAIDERVRHQPHWRRRGALRSGRRSGSTAAAPTALPPAALRQRRGI
jgi:hypothetical protein